MAAAAAEETAGRLGSALQVLEGALGRSPGQPKLLNAIGLNRLAARDSSAAAAAFRQAVALDPAAAPLWLNLATAQRLLGDAEGQLESLERSLVIDPYLLPALVQKAQLLEQSGDRRALATYGAVLNIVGDNTQIPPGLADVLRHARRYIAADQARLAQSLSISLRDLRGQVADAAASRFDHCVDVVLGRRRVFYPQPTGLLYPGLPVAEFFARDMVPWLDRLEAATAMIIDEFRALIDQGAADFVPYVDIAPGIPTNQWEDLNRSPEWSAFFLWKDGERQAGACARCPATAAVLDALPMLDLPGRGPAAFFSILRAGAHIPPHTGVSNVRAVVHLPLIVPPDCGFRVGASTVQWRPGKAFAFDDTIDHEAWNRSDRDRAILILDIWNPYLSDTERALIAALTAALDAHAMRAV